MSLAMKAARGGVQMPISARGYRGDPGLFGFLGKAVGAVTGFASRVLPGPLGGAAGLISRAVTPRAAAPARMAPRTMPGVPQSRMRLPPISSVQLNGSRQFVNGGGAVVTQPGMQEATGVQPGVQDGTPLYRDDAKVTQCPSGFKPNKSAYFEYSEQIGAVVFHPPGTKCVRSRRRNPLNPKAIDRAISRLESGKKAEKRLKRVTIRPKCPGH